MTSEPCNQTRRQFLDLSSTFRIASYSSLRDGPQFSIAGPQQVLPLAKVAFEAHALGSGLPDLFLLAR
jgi:hypothetical protein